MFTFCEVIEINVVCIVLNDVSLQGPDTVGHPFKGEGKIKHVCPVSRHVSMAHVG